MYTDGVCHVFQSGCHLPCFFIIHIFSSPDPSPFPISFDYYLKSVDTLLIVGQYELQFYPQAASTSNSYSYWSVGHVAVMPTQWKAAVSWKLLRLRPLLYWRAQTKFCAPFPRFLSIWWELGLHFHSIILKMVVMKGGRKWNFAPLYTFSVWFG